MCVCVCVCGTHAQTMYMSLHYVPVHICTYNTKLTLFLQQLIFQAENILTGFVLGNWFQILLGQPHALSPCFFFLFFQLNGFHLYCGRESDKVVECVFFCEEVGEDMMQLVMSISFICTYII